jgi:hypothetical protein
MSEMRAIPSDSDTDKERGQNSSERDITRDEADRAPEPHAPSEGIEVSVLRKDRACQSDGSTNQGEDNCLK